MSLLARLLVAAVLFAGLLFCIYGFMATFEPLNAASQFTWRIVYGLCGTVCLLGAVRLVLPRKYGL